MNLRTVISDAHAQMKGVRVVFDRENDILTRVYLMNESGDTYVIKLGSAGGLEVMRRFPDQAARTDQIARIVESDDAGASPAAANQ